jgi:hypothetical protein
MMVVEDVANFDRVVLPFDQVAQTCAKTSASELVVEPKTADFLHCVSGVNDAGVGRQARVIRQATGHGAGSWGVCHQGSAADRAGSTRSACRAWTRFSGVAGGVCSDRVGG